MKDLLERVDRIIEREDLNWKRRDRTVDVELWRSGHWQRVHLDRVDDRYVLLSTVVGSSYVTKSDRRWRDLAYRAWRKNALKELVTFSFDRRHRLIGVIEQPVATLDDEELVFYIRTLAQHCDRFEYILTGEDEE
jgi:hypothetical protein